MALRLERRLRQPVDRLVRLAGDNAGATHLPIVTRDGTGTDDQPVARLDDNVRIGANQLDPALQGPGQDRIIILRPAILVIIRTGAGDEVGRLDIGEVEIEPGIEGTITGGTDIERLARGPLEQFLMDGIARGDHGVGRT